MTLAVVHTRAKLGIQAPPVTVEVHLSNGLPSLSIVGLPETAVKESKDRVRSALINSRFEFPARRITVNLAPADLPKEGGRFDLAIALGVLAASSQIPADSLNKKEFLGELALSGQLRPVLGTLPAAIAAGREGKQLIVPRASADDAARARETTILAADHLLDVCGHLADEGEKLPSYESTKTTAPSYELDLADVKGQPLAKRALEVAAAGGHNLLFFGPPGTGKTLLASRLPTILPLLSDEQALEVAAVTSLCQQQEAPWRIPPFRAPHHTASAVALVGGGSYPKPGEISLAHRGVLFLDELPEFQRHVLEVLREPLESGEISISRASHQLCFPARFQLVAAMNPCPCGYLTSQWRNCRCSPDRISRYREKISGPLLDRIDLHIPVNELSPQELQQSKRGESSATVRQRVIEARERQHHRQGKTNAQLSNTELDQQVDLGTDESNLLNQSIRKLGLSARAYHRILKVSRTIADLGLKDRVTCQHIAEAISFRGFDRQ